MAQKAIVIVVLTASCFIVEDDNITNAEPIAAVVRGDEEFDSLPFAHLAFDTAKKMKASSLAHAIAKQDADGIEKPKKAEVKASSLAETKIKASSLAETKIKARKLSSAAAKAWKIAEDAAAEAKEAQQEVAALQAEEDAAAKKKEAQEDVDGIHIPDTAEVKGSSLGEVVATRDAEGVEMHRKTFAPCPGTKAPGNGCAACGADCRCYYWLGQPAELQGYYACSSTAGFCTVSDPLTRCEKEDEASFSRMNAMKPAEAEALEKAEKAEALEKMSKRFKKNASGMPDFVDKATDLPRTKYAPK